MKVVANRCHGGFGLSEAAYEKLIEWGVPVRKYVEWTVGSDNEPMENIGEIIFDRTLDPEPRDAWMGRYWDTWIEDARTHPLLIRVVEELGDAASDDLAKLRVVEIPDGIEWEIDDYDGSELIVEKHRKW